MIVDDCWWLLMLRLFYTLRPKLDRCGCVKDITCKDLFGCVWLVVCGWVKFWVFLGLFCNLLISKMWHANIFLFWYKVIMTALLSHENSVWPWLLCSIDAMTENSNMMINRLKTAHLNDPSLWPTYNERQSDSTVWLWQQGTRNNLNQTSWSRFELSP